jgi:hypothetical protein
MLTNSLHSLITAELFYIQISQVPHAQSKVYIENKYTKLVQEKPYENAIQ